MLVRLTRQSPDQLAAPLAGADELIAQRRAEADEFYEAITPPQVTDDAKSVMRQALAGMLWSKQTYYFDVDQWLRERQVHPLRAPLRRGTRNESWFHMYNQDVVSMPDKWEYPWYAAWDLAFHCIPLAMVDPDFAKGQIDLMLSQNYLHPTGQMPAYEWNFGDVNPPVHAFAALFLQNLEADLGEVDLPFMEKSFSRLLLNFTWWVNRKDPTGHNVFEGGFLGLDNIGVFDRSAALPTGGSLEQADGTAWMAMFSQNMLEMALALLDRDDNYEQYVLKFVERFFWIAAATDPIGDKPDAMWDEEDGFFYDVLRLPDGSGTRLKVRSLVGLLPICATTVIEADHIEQHPQIAAQVASFLERNKDLLSNIADPLVPGVNGRRLLSLVNEEKLRRILARMLDEERFLGPHGIRSISRWHLEEPYVFDVHGVEHVVQYEPAESTSGMFGGNSNWRGPVWFPINLLLIRALIAHYRYYGDSLKVECPTGSGTMMTLFEVAEELSRRLAATFLRDERRPPPGLRRDQAVPGGPALAGPHPVPRVLPRRQRGRARRLAPDRVDRPGGQADPEPRPVRPRDRAQRPALAAGPPLPSPRRPADAVRLRGRRLVEAVGLHLGLNPALVQPDRDQRVDQDRQDARPDQGGGGGREHRPRPARRSRPGRSAAAARSR